MSRSKYRSSVGWDGALSVLIVVLGLRVSGNCILMETECLGQGFTKMAISQFRSYLAGEGTALTSETIHYDHLQSITLCVVVGFLT